MKRVIVACANGVVTSQTIASKVNRLLKERKINAKVDAINIKSLDTEMRDCVAYISIIKTGKKYAVPEIDGIAFLTGVKQEEELQKLIDVLREK